MASMPRCVMCQSLPDAVIGAVLAHGATTMRFGSVRSRSLSARTKRSALRVTILFAVRKLGQKGSVSRAAATLAALWITAFRCRRARDD